MEGVASVGALCGGSRASWFRSCDASYHSVNDATHSKCMLASPSRLRLWLRRAICRSVAWVGEHVLALSMERRSSKIIVFNHADQLERLLDPTLAHSVPQYLLAGRIWLFIGMHVSWNLAQRIFGTPVSRMLSDRACVPKRLDLIADEVDWWIVRARGIARCNIDRSSGCLNDALPDETKPQLQLQQSPS